MRLKRAVDDRARAARPGARDEVDQLTPAHRRIVAVAGRLVEDGQQTIVKTHVVPHSFETHSSTALREHLLRAKEAVVNHPETGQSLSESRERKRKRRRAMPDASPYVSSGGSALLLNVDQPIFGDRCRVPPDRIEGGCRAGLVARPRQRLAVAEVRDIRRPHQLAQPPCRRARPPSA